ncbi:MAG TPA: hypothetical protein VKE22_16360 [Haliangiales bacterium]|nr:hypothetical protein [Haliangiales bacterium]
MADLRSTLPSGQVPGSIWDGADEVTHVMRAPMSEDITQVMRAPMSEELTQVMAAPANTNLAIAEDAMEPVWGAQATLPRGPGSPAPALPKIPGRTDGHFCEQGIRGTPAGEAHYADVKDISESIAADNARAGVLAREKDFEKAMGLHEKGPTGKAWFEKNYPGGKSALAAEEELAAASETVGSEASVMSEVGEEVGTLAKIGKVMNNPYFAGGMAGLNVIGGAADAYTGINEMMDGKVGYGIADTVIGMGNIGVGAGTIAELAMTGAATASPVGVALGAASLGVKGDKFFQETGLLDGVFGKDENGESHGLMGGIGSVLGKAVHGDTTAILETVGGVSMLPLLLPALATAEVGAGITSLIGSGIDLLGGDSKAVGHAITGTASDIWHHFTD